MTHPWSGSLTVLREVAMEPGGERGLTVIARNPAPTGAVMQINLSGAASTAALRVQVAGSRPVADHGLVRHALQLELLPDAKSTHAPQRRRLGSRVASREAGSDGQLRTLLAADDLVGVLQRDIDARTLNVSGSGCLLETTSPIDEGTVAQLRLRIGGVEYRDDVRVIRCSRVEGAGATHHVGVEFAWTTQPGARSLRRKVRMAPPRAMAIGDTKRPVG